MDNYLPRSHDRHATIGLSLILILTAIMAVRGEQLAVTFTRWRYNGTFSVLGGFQKLTPTTIQTERTFPVARPTLIVEMLL